MAVSMTQHLMAVLPELRYQPTPKHLRVRLVGPEEGGAAIRYSGRRWNEPGDGGSGLFSAVPGAEMIADSDRAVLIWEPYRVVPAYAIPLADIAATLTTAPPGAEPDYRPVGFGPGGPPLLDPSVPFAVHTAPGRPMNVSTATANRDSAAYLLDDQDLPAYVILDFDAFDWWEEDEPIVGHPRDPLHRIDVRRTSQRIRIEHEGVVLADTEHARALFEATFPLVRYYLPAEDVLVELLPGNAATTCAYKGHAQHLTAVTGGGQSLDDIAWTYPDPLPEVAEIAGLVAFYQERLDVSVNGIKVQRVRTPWS